jgi:hypothetical protein
MLAPEIPECHFRNHSDGILGIASTLGQNRPSEYPQVTHRVYLQTNVGLHYPEYQKDGFAVILTHLQK